MSLGKIYLESVTVFSGERGRCVLESLIGKVKKRKSKFLPEWW